MCAACLTETEHMQREKREMCVRAEQKTEQMPRRARAIRLERLCARVLHRN